MAGRPHDVFDNMSAFDKLPRALREALANADHNWSAAQLYRERRKPKAKRHAQLATNESTLAFLIEQDARKHNAVEGKGNGHQSMARPVLYGPLRAIRPLRMDGTR
jgi:hypothetical protein